MCAQRYDIVVFGATGYTGTYVVEEIARTVEEEKGLKWAIAGRSSSKLKGVLSTASRNTGKSLDNIPVIVADISDDASLNNMCQKAKVILNCVGPYRFYGEPVIKACIANKTHHLDLSGEPGFLDKMVVKYAEAAKKAGVFIIGACGWDSIPADMGVRFLRNKFSGELSWVESYVSVKTAPGSGFNIGTWLSAVTSIANRRDDVTQKKALRASEGPVPAPAVRMPNRGMLFNSKEANGWCTLFPGSDKSVVERTQRYGYLNNKETPIQFRAYFRLYSFFLLPFYMFTGLCLGILSQFSFGVWLLSTYPRLFTFGTFSHTGPPREAVRKSSFTMTFIGTGYSTKGATGKPDKRIKTRISGPEAGYISTPICFVQAAYTLLSENDKLPPAGVVTPATAFSRTSLIERLHQHGVKFEVIEA